MNNILLLAIIGISAIVLVAGIIGYQFIQQQQDRQTVKQTMTNIINEADYEECRGNFYTNNPEYEPPAPNVYHTQSQIDKICEEKHLK